MSEPFPAHDLPDEAPLSVSALNRLAREVLERNFPLLWVSGEISNLTRATSGHLYFTLKDEQAQVRCTMWRNRARLLSFRPENGMRVETRALVTLYEPRGDYQLGVETLRRAGVGNLFEAFARLKDKLGTEGLFDVQLKRALPRFPRGVGVVTSPAAAALCDVLATLRRRAPHLPITLYPAPVQGLDAGAMLTRALETAGARAGRDGIDAILLVRGGGSMEDLWAFNDEALARAIRACPLPVVSGVGHETDFTIADFAADRRAATPTMAAELISAGFHGAHGELAALTRQLRNALAHRVNTLNQRIDRAALRLLHPRERLRRATQDNGRLEARLKAALARCLERERARLGTLQSRLHGIRPDLERAGERAAHAGHGLRRALSVLLARRGERLKNLSSHLQHLDPQAVLARGYGIARDTHGNILRGGDGLNAGDVVSVQLADAWLDTRLEKVRRR